MATVKESHLTVVSMYTDGATIKAKLGFINMAFNTFPSILLRFYVVPQGIKRTLFPTSLRSFYHPFIKILSQQSWWYRGILFRFPLTQRCLIRSCNESFTSQLKEAILRLMDFCSKYRELHYLWMVRNFK